MTILVAVGMFFAIVQEVIYLRYNRKVLKKHEEEGGEKPWLYMP